MTEAPPPSAHVVAVQDDILRLRLEDGVSGRLVQNEVVEIRPARLPGAALAAEILRVSGDEADAQVYESTQGVALGDPVTQTGGLLSARLGPGLLGSVVDGLQTPLEALAVEHGLFLPRGASAPPLPLETKWAFTATRRIGDRVAGGDALGTVPEGSVAHRIMVPFALDGPLEVAWIREGPVTVEEPVARLTDAEGRDHEIRLAQDWPVRAPLPRPMLARRASLRLYPERPMLTGQRLIDTFFPVAEGGAACIPGPFGAGKTVLQTLVAKNAAVDVVVIVACGERAGEVVETIREFPRIKDPRTGGSLMDRTVIVCNTSSMPVAAREASIHTGLAIGEYYRQMGLRVLMIADSTSRWAQAMRETSGRLEEIPGEEGYPAYLDSQIKAVYERAGVIRTNDGAVGALAMIGTVSPAGGNFEEPVTQSTLGAVKCFLGLSAERAYKRFYPAVDPLLSWSRYREQLADWYRTEMGADWAPRVEAMLELLHRGEEIRQMIQVTGEEGISLDDFVAHQAALYLDMVYLQQDAFDPVDQSVSPARQRAQFDRAHRIATRDYAFPSREAARDFFTRATGLGRDLNYAAPGSPDEARLLEELAAFEAGAPLAD